MGKCEEARETDRIAHQNFAEHPKGIARLDEKFQASGKVA
jgi:hypothetical protein